MEVISHWHPNITINIVDDHTPWVKGSVPPPLDQCELLTWPFLASWPHPLQDRTGSPLFPSTPPCPLPPPSLLSSAFHKPW